MVRFYVYARLFLAARDEPERSQVFSDAVEWVESTTGTKVEKGLKTRVFAMLSTDQGADFLRWVVGHDG